jgi:redox-sensitive bicupin YhaK (pirin superfamily)
MNDVVKKVAPLGFPWETPDPFLFCVYHDDAYPAGNEQLGPAAPLAGRALGQDFRGQDGWRMYHGEVVPGFPQHPHCGFETVTVVRRGLVDHADSLGATARYGRGDVQWLTTGRGIAHSEMFPLVQREASNPLELFQIWLNLARADKRAEPAFAMLWSETVPRQTVRDESGKPTELTVVAGAYGELRPPSPPPHSWAARESSDVAIWTLKMAPGARFTLPAAATGSNRTLYFFHGSELEVGQRAIPASSLIELKADASAALENGPDEAELLMLQGKPIGEPIAQHGPFVMTSADELQQAFADYRRTRFGGWPWPSDAPVHPRDDGRFARHPDGRFETPG